MSRKIYYWKLRDNELQLGERTLIMGVLNITPDSFSDGGRYNDPDRAYARAVEMEEQGVDIIDIGAESTRPDSKRIGAEEEWQRLAPVLKRLRGKLSVPLSVDTYKSETAERALHHGAEIINDPSGLTFDVDLAKIAAQGNAGLILNHMRGLPETWGKLPPMPDVMGTIARELEATASRARHAGVEKNRIVVDPGLGFGKRKEQNSEILAHLARLAALDYPILAGPSRKSFLAQVAEGDTVYTTAAAVAAAILNGAHIVRVHDVKEMRLVAQIADEIVRAGNLAASQGGAERSERPHAGPRRPPVTMFEQERVTPTRPPLSKPERIEPAAAAAPPAGPVPERRPGDRPVLRAPQDRPSKGWTPERTSRPDQRSDDRSARTGPPGGDRPANDRREGGRFGNDRRQGGRPGNDRRQGGRNYSDRPETSRPSNFRPGGDKQGGDRREGGRSSGDRPFRGAPGSRPPSRGPQDRPSRGPANNGSPRGPRSGPAAPRRPFRKRP